MKLPRTLFALLMAASAVAGAAPAEPLAVDQAWIRSAPHGQYETWAFADIRNTGKADTLVSARSAAARSVELRAAIPTDAGTTFRTVGAIAVAGGETTRLSAETYFLALIAVNRDLVAGASVPVTLHFLSGAEVTVDFRVLAPGPDAKGD